MWVVSQPYKNILVYFYISISIIYIYKNEEVVCLWRQGLCLIHRVAPKFTRVAGHIADTQKYLFVKMLTILFPSYWWVQGA